ncbi:MAG: hypothetical protein RSB38_03255 [Oscillospiraceae bacterium]
MAEVILNEKKYAEEIIKSGNIGDKPSVSLNLLAKYFKQVEGIAGKKLYSKLDAFMSENYTNYNPVKWSITLDKYVRQAGKYKLAEIEYIPITKIELDAISSLSSVRAERIAFSFLCYAKYYNMKNEKNNNWINVDAKNACRDAKVALTVRNCESLIHQILVEGLISLSNRSGNGNIRVEFVDNIGEPVLKISKFGELGYEYMLWKDKGYFRCKSCGSISKQNKNNTKIYCKNCAGYHPAEAKTIICSCGKEFEVSGNVKNKVRCDDCQAEKNKIMTAKRVAKFKEKCKSNDVY